MENLNRFLLRFLRLLCALCVPVIRFLEPRANHHQADGNQGEADLFGEA